jgi:NAD(P)-dependent dehydrogenase (short-subunit alcohol dehydrogenase family)
MRFTDRVALVTGASAGIGRATALLLSGEGASVAAVDVDSAGLESLAREIAARGGTCATFAADVLDEAAVARMVAAVVDRFGGIDVLVNGVGGSTVIAKAGTPLAEMTLDEWERLLAFNLRGTFLCTRAVVPHMKARGAGRIVNLSSIVARGDNDRTNAAYTLAKAGITALTRKLARELGPSGITCNATAPGVTVTERIQARILDGRSPEERAAMAAAVPLGRLATAEDQARIIAFLASDDAAFVSGQTIEVTGGQ